MSSIKSAAGRTAAALAVSAMAALGLAGTAYAAVPGHTDASARSTDTHLQAPPPAHRFRSRFHTLAQCQAQARHDHPNRPGDWDCRRGPDRNNPWEYWGI